MTETNRLLFDFIAASPTPYHAVSQAVRRLEESGFIPLSESEEWQPECGKSYYVTRGRLVAHRFYRAAGGLCGLYDSCIGTQTARPFGCVNARASGAAGMTRAVGRGLRRNAEVFMARPSAFRRGACDGAYPARRGVPDL